MKSTSNDTLFWGTIIIFFMLLFSTESWALRIDISQDDLIPIPIAIPDFVPLNQDGTVGTNTEMGEAIAVIVSADLDRSGLFRMINPQSFLQKNTELWLQGPDYNDWRQIGSEAVVASSIQEANGQITVNFFLHDVFQGTLIGKGKRLSAPAQDWRYIGHRVADEIYTRLTGESGYFSSRITFVAESGNKKWLSLMDQDGANRIDLTPGTNLVLTPRFSPNGKHLFYLSYETGFPRIFRWDLYTGKRFMQGNYEGLNSTPSWSPDGQKMALTLSKDGNPEIYVKNLGSEELRRLTDNRGIDTSPSWSPDGNFIVFNSDRGGSPQLYIMRADGSDQQRITFEGKYNAAPAWSPRGDKIAFVKGGEGKFRIAITDKDGRQTKVLTDSWMDESPSWAPNGRVILFSRQVGDHTRLYTIDLSGHNERLLPMGNDLEGSDPSWSPLIR
ncbi:MAG: Tol-Pal system beta propeller repeat protein TolB [Magnetococcus sp. DMHC-6]